MASRSGSTTEVMMLGGTLRTIHPIARPPAAVSDRKNYDFRREVLIHNAEGKFSEIRDVDWPALGRFSDSSCRLLKGTFKIDCCNQATLSIPTQRCQILLFRSRMKSKRFTCHAAGYVPSAGPLPRG